VLSRGDAIEAEGLPDSIVAPPPPPATPARSVVGAAVA
jgi:hypothetical protein